MTESSVWDDPEIQDGDYYTFKTVGDSCSGLITAIGTHKWDDGKVDPELTLVDDKTGQPTRLTAGQVRLKAELVERRPSIGDHISVTFASEEKRAMGKSLKHWSVVITPAAALVGASVAAPQAAVAAPVAAPAAAVAPAAIPTDPAAVAAAMANLSPEDRARLGLPPIV